MISKTEVEKKMKAARGRGVLFKDRAIREEWFAISRSWHDLALDLAEDENEPMHGNGS